MDSQESGRNRIKEAVWYSDGLTANCYSNFDRKIVAFIIYSHSLKFSQTIWAVRVKLVYPLRVWPLVVNPSLAYRRDIVGYT